MSPGSMRSGEAGATSTEYALLAALIALAIFFAVAAVGDTLPGVFEQVDSQLDS